MAYIADLADGSRPVTMATGYFRPYQSMLQVRQQVIAVLTSDWTVLCLDHQFKVLWKTKLPRVKEGTSEFVIRYVAMTFM